VRAVADLDGGYAEAHEPGDEPLARVVGVDRAQLVPDRVGGVELVLVLGLVEVSREADHAVGVDEPRRDDPGPQLAVAGGHGEPDPDLLDLPVLDQDNGVLQGSAGHRVDRLAAHGELGLGRGGGRQRDRGDAESDRAARHRPYSSSSKSPQRWGRSGWSWPAPKPPTA